MDNPNQPNGIIDFKKAKNQLNAARKAKKSQDKASSGGGGLARKGGFLLYLQYILLLGIVAYMMQLCRS